MLARTIFVSFFLLLLVGVFSLRRDYVFKGAPDRRLWRDLRLWAFVLVLVHVYVYWRF